MEVVPATRKPREKSREKKTPVRSKKGNEGTPHGSETAKTSQNPDRGPAAPLTSRDGASRVPIGSENILTGVSAVMSTRLVMETPERARRRSESKSLHLSSTNPNR